MSDQASSGEKSSVPSDLQNYLDLDLSPNGLIAQDLLNRLNSEVSLEDVRLSELTGPQPANITQEMVNWYQTYIASARLMALHAISRLFKERSDPSKGEAFLPHARLGSLEENLLIGKLRVYRNHFENNVAVSEEIRGLEKQIADDQHKYDVRKAELGREAELHNRVLYYAVLVLIVFVSEALINFEAFEAIPGSTPAYATGLVMAFGFILGAAAHLHGTVFKQWAYYFDASEDDSKRGPAWRMVTLGVVAMIVTLSFVYYARSIYLASYIRSMSGFGQSAGPLSFFQTVRGSLTGNIGTYIGGVLWAYFMHDSDPDFVTLKRRLDKNKRKAGALKQKLEASRHRQIEQLNAIYDRKVKETQSAAHVSLAQSSLTWPQELFRKFQAKDALVVGLLHNYRQALIQRMGAQAKSVKFIACLDDPHASTANLTAGAFAQKIIKLKYLEEA